MSSDSTVCPSCGERKDRRSKLCRKCSYKKIKDTWSSRGDGWNLHKRTGYIIGCFNGVKMYQHREIYSFFLGRKLFPGEVVHHKDGNKTNNSIENLELLESRNHGRIHLSKEKAKERSIKGHKARWGYEYESAI